MQTCTVTQSSGFLLAIAKLFITVRFFIYANIRTLWERSWRDGGPVAPQITSRYWNSGADLIWQAWRKQESGSIKDCRANQGAFSFSLCVGAYACVFVCVYVTERQKKALSSFIWCLSLTILCFVFHVEWCTACEWFLTFASFWFLRKFLKEEKKVKGLIS